MPKQPAPQVTAWSFSRWATYQKCPRKFKYQAIDRLPEAKGPALIRGQEIHDLAERYVRGELKDLPPELTNFDEEFFNLYRGYQRDLVETEDMLCFDRDWNYLPGAKFEPSIWCRVKKDATLLYPEDGLAVLVDYKTGRVQPDPYWEQLDLYALATFLTTDWAELVQVELWFLDHGVVKPDDGVLEYERGQVPKLKKDWNARVKKMFNDRRFDPTPSDECRWCTWAKSKGGPCEKG